MKTATPKLAQAPAPVKYELMFGRSGGAVVFRVGEHVGVHFQAKIQKNVKFQDSDGGVYTRHVVEKLLEPGRVILFEAMYIDDDQQFKTGTIARDDGLSPVHFGDHTVVALGARSVWRDGKHHQSSTLIRVGDAVEIAGQIVEATKLLQWIEGHQSPFVFEPRIEAVDVEEEKEEATVQIKPSSPIPFGKCSE